MTRADQPVPTLTHPTMKWELSNDDESRTTIMVDYAFAMPDADTPPQDAVDPTRWRHPYPNCFRVRIEAADENHVMATLTRREAERMHRTLTLALAWDGQ